MHAGYNLTVDSLRSRITVWSWILTATFVGITAGVTGVFWKQIPPQIPIFYSRAWGEAQLGSPIWLFGVAVVIAVLGGVGFVAAKKIGDLVLCFMVTCLILVAQVVMTLGVLRILMLVI